MSSIVLLQTQIDGVRGGSALMTLSPDQVATILRDNPVVTSPQPSPPVTPGKLPKVIAGQKAVSLYVTTIPQSSGPVELDDRILIAIPVSPREYATHQDTSADGQSRAIQALGSGFALIDKAPPHLGMLEGGGGEKNLWQHCVASTAELANPAFTPVWLGGTDAYNLQPGQPVLYRAEPNRKTGKVPIGPATNVTVKGYPQ